MAAAWVSTLAAMAAMLALALSLSGKCSAEDKFRHHVVGDDRGWDPTSDVASWAAGRIFVVGDTLWFMYSAAQEKVVEVGSRDEFEACDLSNPIRMYTDGLSKISLNGEGTRFFVSGDAESCKKGLRLPVEVKPQSPMVASAPSSPSGSGRMCVEPAVGLGALLGGALLLWV